MYNQGNQKEIMELTSPSEIRRLSEKYGFDFSKSLGQNFLINAAIPVKIAEGADIEGKNVLEIGPGIGCLTRQLCSRAKSVITVEIDKRLIPILDETLADFDNVKVINDDILNVDLSTLFDGQSFSVCANLPYYITTPIIMHLLESGAKIDSITVMVQKELARRFTSQPNTADYGSVTASIMYYAKASTLFGVSAGSFCPAPKVDSAVIKLDILPENMRISVKNKENFFRVIKAAFAMRRKTLVNNLSQEFKIPKSDCAAILSSLGLSETIRGEALSIEKYAQISDKMSIEA